MPALQGSVIVSPLPAAASPRWGEGQGEGSSFARGTAPHPNPLPADRGERGHEVDIRAISRAARTFTGDFYVTHRNANRLWIAVGDVAGKGLPAAIVMAMIQEELEQRIASCAETRCNPATTLRRLHEFLLPLLPQNRFATAVIAHLDHDGLLTIANGGHCPPLVVRNDGTIEEIASTGPLLGILPGAKWCSLQTHLAPGESLLLYSDGVTESLIAGEELGVAGLRALVARLGACPASIVEELGGVSDDLTLVAITR
jgi:serine phosphatase RsbU (regulator of sigma subunit)